VARGFVDNPLRRLQGAIAELIDDFQASARRAPLPLFRPQRGGGAARTAHPLVAPLHVRCNMEPA